MSRVLILAVLIASHTGVACSKGSKPTGEQGKAPATAGEEKKISVPGADKGSAPGEAQPTGAPSGVGAADDPRFHLNPEEGSLKVDKAEGKAGAEATAKLEVTPATGYHVATDYPIKLVLEAPAGVKLAKTELTAGGRDKAQGDAAALSEQGLAFAVKATPEKAGSYEIKGVLKFGICEKESCHPKKQPITITVAAN